MRRQRSPLTLKQVVALEKLMERKPVGPELVALGHMLFALHTCSRWSDTLSLVGPPKLDDVLIEAEAKRTKVSKGLKRLRVPVPFLGMATGVSNTPWARIWITAREACQVPHDPAMPKITSASTFGTVAMTSTEASRLMRAFLHESMTPPMPQQ
eukprot:3277534-Amphidinium_carterae.1